MASEAMLQELSRILREQVGLHEALKGHLEEESAQDGRLNGAALLRAQQLKYQTARQIQELETRRMALVRELAKAWGRPPEELTLKRIVPRASPETGAELLASHAALTALMETIRELAGGTSANAQARLLAVDATLAVIHEAVKVHPTYSGAGKLRAQPVTFTHTAV
jgi:hypothetical protein